jgi:TamB, inner membrane protein subunit of TAM complex
MKRQVTKKRIVKIFLYGSATVLVLFAIAYLVLQLPSVQKALIDRYLGKFENKSKFEITTERLHLYWYDRLEVSGLKVVDPVKNEMIFIDQLLVNFQIAQLTENKEVNIDGVTLDSTRVNLVYIPDSDTSKDININEFTTAINKMFAPPPGSTPKSPKVNIGEVVLTNSFFSLHHPDKDSVLNRFDQNHFKLELGDAQLDAFKVIGDTIQFNLLSMVGEEVRHQWPIHEMKTFFRVSQGGMEFLNLSAEVGKSFISDTVILKYNSMKDLSDFVNKVSVQAKLKSCTLHPEDIQFFSGKQNSLPSPIHFSGGISGKVKHFYYQDMDLRMGNSRVFGSLEMDGLPSIRETFINLAVNRSAIDINTFEFALPPFAFVKLKPLQKFSLSGDYIGFLNDFVADGKIRSDIGEIDSDINLKIDESNVEKSRYTGNLSLVDFKLGEYLEDTISFKNITMSGNISGNGLTASTADFVMQGRVASVGLLNYVYTNIESNARFTKNFFNGTVTIRDPNLSASVVGSVDLRNRVDLIDVRARIDTARLRALRLVKTEFSFHSDVAINSKGLQIDSLRGTARLSNINLMYKENSLAVDSIALASSIKGHQRTLEMRSSYGTLDLTGNFFYSTMFHDFQNIFEEFYLNIKNDKVSLAKYYGQKDPWDQDYKADFSARLTDINPVLKFFNVNVEVAKDISIEGDFTNGYTSIFHAFSTVKSFRVKDKVFYDNEIEFNGSKIHDTTSVLALLTVTSKNQFISKKISTKDLLMEAIWNRDHIDVGVDFDQMGYDNSMRIKAEVDFLTDSTRVRLLPSTIKAFGQNWSVNPRNLILFKGKEFSIEQFEISYGDETNRVHGKISEDPSNELQVLIKNVGIDLVNSLTQEKFTGTLNADFALRNLYGDFTFQNEFTIDKLAVNDFLVGDVRGSSTWDPDQDAFIMNFFVDRLQTRIVDITGLYNPDNKEMPLNLTARLNKASLKIIEPIMRGLFSNWDGTATGVFDVRGILAKPEISGEAMIENGKVTVDYLKTTYGIAGKFGMSHNLMSLQNLVLTDAFGNKGEVDGIIAHKEFSMFRISLDGRFKNFQVLNTTAKDNSLFYGQAYGTGSLNILGPFDNLKISATAKTDRNTRMYIPISGTSNVQRSDFITFTSFRDTVKKKDAQSVKKKTASNFTMNLNLDITPDAYAEIIFDLKAGDIIRGYGRGEMKLDLDTKGEFSMFGLYEFERGFYNFTLGGVINKEFAINKGSRISWFGDPYAGVVNITAGYRQLASIAPILTDPSLAQSPQLRRKFPIEVQLKLEGPMLGPQISFDIVAKDLPETIVVDDAGKNTTVRPNFEFNAFKARLDEQELKKQVFSLIVLRRFSPPDAFTTSGGIANSVSEFLSNQLSYWLSQVDENLEVNLDLGTLDQEAFNTYQLRMSYSFMNGRLRITRDGSLSANQFARSDVASIAGDWTVDYLLTPDGKFKAKMYSRSNYNALLQSIGAQTAVTTGLSLAHVQSFNEFADLFRSARRKRQEDSKLEPNASGDVDDDN